MGTESDGEDGAFDHLVGLRSVLEIVQGME